MVSKTGLSKGSPGISIQLRFISHSSLPVAELLIVRVLNDLAFSKLSPAELLVSVSLVGVRPTFRGSLCNSCLDHSSNKPNPKNRYTHLELLQLTPCENSFHILDRKSVV